MNSIQTVIGQVNAVFSCLDDFSATAAQMQTQTDPYPAGVESLATTGQGEIERLRYQIQQIHGRTYWYQDPSPLNPPGDIQLGVASTRGGLLHFYHTSSAFTTAFQAGNATGAATYVWPLAAPATGPRALYSNTVGTLSWAASLTANGVLYTASTGEQAATAQGGANTVLTANAGVPSFSATPTINTSLQLGVASSTLGALKLAHGSSALLTTFQAGNATEANTYVWPADGGTSGQVLQTDGATPTTALSWVTPGALRSVQVFTSGTPTWTRPAGVTKVMVEVIGGGGGGSGANGTDPGNGGGGGGYSAKVVDVSALGTVAVTVGGGGAGSSSAGAGGGPGGTSSFGAHASATGGGEGGFAGAAPGAGGSGSSGDLNVTSGSGHRDYGVLGRGSSGGNAFRGGSGGANTLGTGSAGFSYGGGGGGAAGTNTGGAGAAGVVIVWEY